MKPAAQSGIIVRWSSVSNRYYALSRSSNLLGAAGGFVDMPDAIKLPATPQMNTYTDAVNGLGPFFYTIKVRQ